jgi:hypothetical protein
MAAQKITVGDVLKAGQTVGTAGKGKVPHIVVSVPEFDGRTVTLCTKTAAGVEDFSHTPDTTICVNCARRFPTITEGSNMATKSNAPESTETPADDKAAEAAAVVEGMPTDGSTTERVKRDAAAREKAAAAKVATPAPKPSQKGKAVAVKGKAAEVAEVDYSDNETVVHLVAEGAEKAKTFLSAEKAGRASTAELATIMLDMRRQLRNKDGLPDLMGASDKAKKASADLFTMAGLIETTPAEGEEPDELTKVTRRLKSAVRNMVGDYRVMYVRRVHEREDEAALYPGLSDADAICKAYKFANETQSETKARKALESKAKPALEAAKPAASAEGGETLESVAESAAPEVKPVAVLRRVLPVLPGLLDYVESLSGRDMVEFMGQMDKLEEFIANAKAIYAPKGEWE